MIVVQALGEGAWAMPKKLGILPYTIMQVTARETGGNVFHKAMLLILLDTSC